MTRLLDRLRHGDTAFERALGPHMDALARMALRLTGDQTDADDLLQDVLTQLYARRRFLTRVQALRPWLLQVLYRRYVDRWRGDEPDSAPDGDRAQEVASAEGDAPDAVFDRALTVERLQQSIDGLSPAHREVLLMHDVEGYSLPEIAAIMEVPEGTLKSRLHRARAGLREALVKLDGTFWTRAS